MGRLKDKAVRKGPKEVLGGSVVGAVRQRYSGYPTRGLTPERLSAIFMEADLGHVLRQMELYEEMEEKDAHLASLLQTRRLAVAGLEWEISGGPDAAGGGLGGLATEAVALVREALGRPELEFGRALLDLLDAVAKGFSVVEILWELEGGRVMPVSLQRLAQQMFTFAGRDSVLSEPMLLTNESPAFGEPLVPGKFIVHKSLGRGTGAARAGVLRPCAWPYLFKNYTLKDWVVFNERFAQPLRIGRFSAGATEAERKVLKDAVFHLGSDAAAVISESTSIELMDMAGKGASSGAYEALANFCDSSMSKAVLGQTLTTEQSGGTYATAKVHQGVRQDVLEADCLSLARSLQRDLLRPLVEFNLGPRVPVPLLRFKHESVEDLRGLAETYRVLGELGLKIPMEHLAERFGIPD